MRERRLRKSLVWDFYKKTGQTAYCNICQRKFKFSGNTSNLYDHLRRRHIGYLYDINDETLPNDTPGTSMMAELSSVTESPMHHDTVHQLQQSEITDPFTMKLPAGTSTAIQPPDFKITSTSSLDYMQHLELIKGGIHQTKPILPDKPTEISEEEKHRIDYSLIKMLMADFQSLSIVENKSFLEYSYNLQPLYKVPNRQLLSNNMLPTLYQEIKQKVYGILQEVSYVAASTDIWTSDSNKEFLALTSHFIFGNKLVSAVLSVKEIPESHTTDNIAKTISTILEEWNISTKVVTIVTDNDVCIKKAIENLKISRHPCVAHTLNLCVAEAIEQVSEFSVLLKTCRSLVKYFKQSTIASESLKQMQREMEMPELKVKQDFATVCSSSIIMLDRLLELKEPLSAIIATLHNAPTFLNASEWNIVRDCTPILRPLELMTKELSAQKYVTISSVIPLMRGLQSSIAQQMPITSCGRHLKAALLDILNRRLGILEMDKSCAKATFLDARFKNLVFSIEANGNNAKKWIIDEIAANINESNCTNSANVKEEIEVSDESQQTTVSLWSFMREVAGNATTMASNVASATANFSVEQYLNMGLIHLSQDPLEFWNRNEKLLPELFQISQKYLCIPVSCISSERIFSKAGQIDNETRNKLEGEMLNQTVFLNCNLELDL